ncbi:hypothetical protein [Mesorhizobium sp.]|uniref:hypothetical protein n=1 Tax=Mesorhizobium sp. TaxID=1871066 RepID=UPI000FE2D357|nr:hypothetical protein [Mesorhizobium sp.]RWN59387.1 MAG: hypothetical protein EOR98_03155 [Mesorhizobium sp.]RWN80892.1 MAG: hypothetical protein EOS02_03145 [Mesorhizobium sp.]RWN83321.1 MAG: hypothetical protein EOS01_03195 [Mesorhizobium sp.]RWN86759.1 MAG: hypothetical protein EOS04_17835 [Mesorhizobium sp.]RWO16394.1 MAG: hypothetical protein EOS15_05230 [Mesorhizobium sp.]
MQAKKLAKGQTENIGGAGGGAGVEVTATVQPPTGVKMAQATVNITYAKGGNSSIQLQFPGQARKFTDVTSFKNVGPAEVLISW